MSSNEPKAPSKEAMEAAPASYDRILAMFQQTTNHSNVELVIAEELDAFAATRVKEALEKAARVADSHNMWGTADAIRALMGGKSNG